MIIMRYLFEYVPTVLSDERKCEVRVPAPIALAPATNNLSDAIVT